MRGRLIIVVVMIIMNIYIAIFSSYGADYLKQLMPSLTRQLKNSGYVLALDSDFMSIQDATMV